MKRISLSLAILAFACFFCQNIIAQPLYIKTVIGGGSTYGDGGPATAAQLTHPTTIYLDAAGNKFVADFGGGRIRKVNSAGIISTVAGGGLSVGDGGPATAANIGSPTGIWEDAGGNILIGEQFGCRIRKVNTAGIISTIAGNGTCTATGDGGPATAATTGGVTGILTDAPGNIYFVDWTNGLVRKIDPSGNISTIAGGGSVFGDGGPATAATLATPYGISLDGSNNLFIGLEGQNRVRVVNLTTGIITTAVGNGGGAYSGDGGPATDANVFEVDGVYADANSLYIAVGGSNNVRKVDRATGIISTLTGNTAVAGFSGDGGPAGPAKLSNPPGVMPDNLGNLYVADFNNGRIRELLPNNAPFFISGNTLTVSDCEDSSLNINSLLTVHDSDAGQTERWTLISGPSIGSITTGGVGGINTTVVATGFNVTPSSIINYIPATGFNGADSFFVRVTDSLESDTIKIRVNVNPGPAAISGSLTTCIGSTTTLVDGISGGTWSSGATAVATVTPGGIVHGAAIGTATISYTTSCGTATVVLTVTAGAGTISPPTASICAGGSTTLTAAVSGGIWSSSSTLIATVASAGSNLGIVFGANPGTSTILYALGSCVSSAVITVTSAPAPIVGRLALCAGTADTLTDATSGGFWSTSNSSVASISPFTGILFGAIPGTSTITYNTGTSCTASVIVTVVAAPSAITPGGTVYLCVGQPANLTDVASGGVWSSANTSVATVLGSGSVASVTGVLGGTAVIIYAVAGCSVSQTVTVIPSAALTPASSSICVGSTESFTEPALTSPYSGFWSSGSTSVATITSSGVVSGASTGTDVISYQLFVGSTIACSYTATVNVTTGAGTITPTTSVTLCSSATTVLSDLTTGGVWSSANTGVATVAADGTVHGVAAGTATIVYTVGSCSVSKTVTVIAGPAAISPATTAICNGTTATLIDGSTGGVWSSSNTAVASVTGGTVGGISPGTATISYTVGSCAATTVITVNATPAPLTPSVALSICSGASSVLGETTTGGVWSSNNTGVATVAGGTVYGVSAGTATISYTIGTCSVVKIVTILNGPAPITPASPTVCTGTSLSLVETTSGGTWSSGATGVATVSAGGSVGGVTAGTAVISYTAGTCTATTTVTVVNSPTAIGPSAPVSFCVGASTELSEGTTGGSWSSGNTAIATVDATGIVTGVAVGTALISYSAGICTVTKVVTVNPGPSALSPSSPAICTGSTLTLTDASTGGTWSSSSTSIITVTSGGIVTGVGVGTANIYYIIGSCVATATVTVTPAPSVGSITGTTSLCVGSTTPLTESATGGTWSSDNTAVATVTAAGIVHGVSNGTATISYSAPSSCGIGAATHIVTVNTTPSAGTIVGPSGICSGSIVNLTNTVLGGTWSASNTRASVNVTTGQLTGITPGVDTISYKVITPCGNATTTFIVTVGAYLSAGTIGGATTMCGGTTLTLTETMTGGTWSASNSSASVSGPAVTGSAAGGIDTIIYTMTAACGTATATHIMTINPAPDAGTITGISSICTGNTVTLTETSTSGTWSSSNTNASVGSDGTVTGVAAGTAVISYTASNSCGTIAATLTVNISATATAGTISGPTNVCPGTPVTLTSSVGGGTWSSSGAATVSSSGLVTGVTAGTATISYTVAGSCGTAVATYPITVSSTSLSAGTILGVSSLCIGSYTIFTDAAPGGAWSASNTTATVTSGGVVTGASAGIDTIYYTVTNSCGTAVASQIVNISSSTLTAGAITGAGNVCIGFPVTLTESVGGGVWSASNGHASVSGGVVTGLSSGMDTIVYTVTTACGTAVASFPVNVTSGAPSAGTIIGGPGICMGYPVLLTDAIAGGVWSVSNTHATISATGLVTGVTAGSATVSYTVSTPCGTSVATKAITISAASTTVAAISGPSTVCTGYTITLSDATPAGAWTSGSGNATVSGTGAVTGVTTGTATISYSVTLSCGLATVMKNITINPASGIASISGAATVCAGGSITLTETATGGVWSSGSANATVSPAGMVTGVSTGTAAISYSVTSGACGTISAISVITVMPSASAGIAPILGSSIVCVGSGITLTDATPGGTWVASNGNAVVVGAGIIDGVSPGMDTISYMISGSCGIGSVTKILAVDTIPIVAPIVGPSSQCVGTTITMTDPTPAGVWTTSTPAVGTVGLTSGIVTGLTVGVTTITYTVTNAYGCPGSVVQNDAVTTPSILTPITGSGAVCVAATTILSNATTGGVWSSSNTTIAVVDPISGAVTGVAPGSTTITYTLTNSCGTSSVTATETVNGLPMVLPIGGAATGCVGSAVTLTDGTPGGVWSSVNTAIATVDASGNVTGVSSSLATINYTVTNALGCSQTQSTSIFINPAPSVPAISGTPSECVGATTSLSDGLGGGVWSSSNTSIATVDGSGNVTGVLPGTVTISYIISAGGGCPGIATVTDVVNVIPVSSPITGTLHVCPGATTALSNAIPGGAWTSGSSNAFINATTGVVTGILPGTAVITYAVSNDCGSSTVTAIVTVYSAPTVSPIAAAYTAICMGNSLYVSDPTPGGTWVTGNTSIATVSSGGVVTGVAAGMDTIYYVVTNASGCSASAMLDITIGGTMPAASVTPTTSTTICAGHSVFMHVISAGGITYQWLRNGVAIAGATASGYTATTTGNYAVVISNGVCSETLTGPSIAAPPVPVIAFTPPNVLFTGTYATYQWYRNGVAIPGATSNVYNETENGAYTVVVTDASGCTDSSAAYIVGGPSAGVNGQPAIQAVRVYPNPATSTLHIDAAQPVTATVMSIDGKLLIEQKEAKDIDVSHLAGGMYLVMIYDSNGMLLQTTKFAKAE